MPHDSTYNNANQVGRQIYDLLTAPHDDLHANDTATPDADLIDAFDEIQRMNKHQLMAAWDGLFLNHERARHIARHLARNCSENDEGEGSE